MEERGGSLSFLPSLPEIKAPAFRSCMRGAMTSTGGLLRSSSIRGAALSGTNEWRPATAGSTWWAPRDPMARSSRRTISQRA